MPPRILVEDAMRLDAVMFCYAAVDAVTYITVAEARERGYPTEILLVRS